MKRFRDDLRQYFGILHYDVKGTQRLQLTNNEKSEQVGAKERRQEGQENDSSKAQKQTEKNEALEGTSEAEFELWSPKANRVNEKRIKQLRIAECEARVVTRQVVMGGSTLVTYGAGLEVQHLVCGYDSSFLTIKNLPQNVQPSEIEELFTQLEVNRSLFYIVKLRQIKNGVQAKILLDAEVGKEIAPSLACTEFCDDHYLDITVGNDPTPGPKEDMNILTVIWTLSSSTMTAQYSTEDAAADALRRLNNSIFRRRKIQAERYTVTEVAGCSTSTPTIKISGLPLNATTTEVKEFSSASSTQKLTVNPGHNLSHIVERIKGFEGYEVNLPNPNRHSAEVRFQFNTWNDAKMAQKLLQGWRLSSDYPPLHTWSPMAIQFSISVPLPQYQAQKGILDSMPVEKDNDKSAFLRVLDEMENISILVLGEDKKAVGKLKVRVDNLLAGETLDSRFWHRSFMDLSGQNFLKSVCARTKVHIQVDSESKILKLYADKDVKQAAIDLVEAKIVRLGLSECSVSIPPSTTEFFIRKGLRMLKEELGQDAVRLEIHPKPRLIIRGSEDAYQRVDRLIEESLNGIVYEPHDGDTCPTCFGKPSSPVLLSCGHVYCADCIRHFLSSAADRKLFPLVCSGNEAKCGVPIAIPIICRFLLQQQFDQLVEAAVKAYIEKQPKTFRYCPTPGCMQTYRCRNDSWTLICPSCFVTVCSNCHKEAHEGITCRQKQIGDKLRGRERLNEEWARKEGAKRCPSCRIWIQKTDGCNHMSCRCGAHICWNCLATFPETKDVYDHLHSVHGGMGIDDMQTAQPMVPGTTVNDDVRHLDCQCVELGEGDELNIECVENRNVQSQVRYQPNRDIGQQRLEPMRRSPQIGFSENSAE